MQIFILDELNHDSDWV